MPLFSDYSEKLNYKREVLNNRIMRRYGEENLPTYLNFNYPKDKMDEDTIKFKKLFQIEDPKLKTYLWNCIILWPDEFENIRKIDFSEEEYDFIRRRIDARVIRKSMNYEKYPNKNKEIIADRIILRSPSEEDAHRYKTYLKQDGDFEMYTGLKLKRKNLQIFSPFRSPFTFAVIEKETGNMIGLVGLYGYDDIRRMANIEWYMFRAYRKQGYMKEAIKALSNAAFDKKLFEMREELREDIYKKHFAKIDILRAAIRVSNKESQKTAVSCGFKEQYLDRRHAIIDNNKFEDSIIFDLERYQI